MLGFVRNLFSSSRPAPATGRTLRMRKTDRGVEAAYDAAQTSELNRRYWRNADHLAADGANSAEVRRTLRSRARYEIHEANGIGKGMILTLANDTIGRGPRLQMLTTNPEVNRRLEAAFMRWSQQVRLAKKLRTMRMAKCVDGEAFALFTNNPRFPEVQLDLRLIEADQIATPMFSVTPGDSIDGIEVDEHGNPTIYHLLRFHPGSAAVILGDKFDRIDAADMLHVFRCDRPGLHRGIPEITTSLPLFALLRDYVLAVLHNVRSAAKFTLLLETQSGAVDDNGIAIDPDVSAFDAVDIDYDMMTALPHGYKASQLTPAHPTSTYNEYTQSIIGQIGRPLSMPLNVALMDSSKYNYASGRLDHQTYFKAIDVERSEWETDVLDRILSRWFDEAVFVNGLLPDQIENGLPHRWFWDGREHVDPKKEADGQAVRLKNGTSHRAREYAREGLDVDAEDQRAAESFGMTVAEYRSNLAASLFKSKSAPSGKATDGNTPKKTAATNAA